MDLRTALDSIADRRVILFGGKGGVGKTTISSIAALHYSDRREVVLFTTDPASNLDDIFSPATRGGRPAALRVEALDAAALYSRFLAEHLENLLEVGDRGTYFDREELRRFFELSLPGIDELMAWLRIGEIVEESPEALVIVDTAPTGHTLRMLGAAEHFRELSIALDALQAKHRAMVQQFTRRSSHDAIDAWIEEFEAQARRRRELLTTASRAAFVPVLLSEPWVVEQTLRLVGEVREEGLDVPFALLNRAITTPDCRRDRDRAKADAAARGALAPLQVFDVPRSCVPLDHVEMLRHGADGRSRGTSAQLIRGSRGAQQRARSSHHESGPKAGVPPPSGTVGKKRKHAAQVSGGTTLDLPSARLLFLAGKGGVGKTSCAASIALQLAAAHPARRFTLISVDPAHSVRDLFATEQPPSNLAVETIDTRALWTTFRESLGDDIERAVSAITPGHLTVAYDADAVRKLLDIAPPGADELFAISRLSDLISDASQARIVVDTAPTGHFLRLLELPQTAGEWVRELMRILLRYRDLVPAGSLGEELVKASRALKDLDAALHSERASVLVVTRPERLVVSESARLVETLGRRGIAVGAIIANYVAPLSECLCDASMRAHELAALASLPAPVVVERRDAPVTALSDLARLVPLRQTDSA